MVLQRVLNFIICNSFTAVAPPIAGFDPVDFEKALRNTPSNTPD
jgi:hypothetical protein